MSEKKDIFISYSNVDRDGVEQIVNTIKYYGVSCWFQLRDSKQHYIEEINQAINNSRDFVIFLSNASVSSLMVRNEISRAIFQQKKDASYDIVPVVIGDLSEENLEIINLYLGSLNWIYADKYADPESLALAIFEQAGIEPVRTEEHTQSAYSTEKEAEKIRLKEQNKYFNVYAEKYLDEVFLKYDDPAVLDVGCDTGDNILLRLQGRKYRFLVGVDRNPAAVEEAAASAPENAAFLCCDVTSDDFVRTLFGQMQRLRIIGFDVIHISAVLLHLAKVDELLKNLYMLLNPGGTIFIQDEDDGVNLAYPNSTYFDDCFYIWEHSKESGDRSTGRKLPSMLQEAGFRNIALHSSAISSVDFGGKFKEELWDLYFNPELWSADSAAYFDNYEAFDRLGKVQARHAQMKADYMSGKYFIMLGIFFLTATKE